MRNIDPTVLTGLRAPTAKEWQQIVNVATPGLKKTCAIWKGTALFCGTVLVTILLCLLIRPPENEISTAAVMTMMMCGIIKSLRSQSRAKREMEILSCGQFRVTECVCVRYYTSFATGRHTGIVAQCCSGGSLFDYSACTGVANDNQWKPRWTMLMVVTEDFLSSTLTCSRSGMYWCP